jgi:hypothetical protein
MSQRGPVSSRSKKGDSELIGGSRGKKRSQEYKIDLDFVEEDQPPVEKIDFSKANVEVVGQAGLDIQEKSKAAVLRMQGKIG